MNWENQDHYLKAKKVSFLQKTSPKIYLDYDWNLLDMGLESLSCYLWGKLPEDRWLKNH